MKQNYRFQVTNSLSGIPLDLCSVCYSWLHNHVSINNANFFSTTKCEIPNWRLLFPLLLSQLKYFWNGAAETYLNQAFYCICKIYRNHIDEGAPSQHSPWPLPRSPLWLLRKWNALCAHTELISIHNLCQTSLCEVPAGRQRASD